MVLIIGGLLQENVAIYRSVPTPHSAPRRAPGLFGHRKSPASNSEYFGRIKCISVSECILREETGPAHSSARCSCNRRCLLRVRSANSDPHKGCLAFSLG